MIQSKVLHLIVQTVLLSASAIVFAGNEVRNGTDRPDELEGSAWFVDASRAVQACVEVDSSFEVSSSDVIKNIKLAISAWSDYYIKKKVNLAWRSSFDYRISESCEGHEDMVFYFGVNDDKISKAKKNYFDPLAFAHRVSYDPKTGWGRGFIWVSPPAPNLFPIPQLPPQCKVPGLPCPGLPPHRFPDWTIQTTLLEILVHELGHVLGVEHVPGTVMDANFIESVRSHVRSENISFNALAIDRNAEILLTPGIREFPGFFNDNQTGKLADSERFLFLKLVGRPPAGKVNARVVGFTLPSNRWESINGEISEEIYLEYFDLLGKTRLKLIPSRNGKFLGSHGANKVFKATRVTKFFKSYGLSSQYTSTERRVFTGQIVDQSNNKLPVVFSFNMSNSELSGLLQILVIEDGDLKLIFYSNEN